MPTNDEMILRDVVVQLCWDERVDASRLHVEVDSGVVTLRGAVPSSRSLHAALESARKIPGVREVVDRMVIRLPTARNGPSDEEIRESVTEALTTISDIEPDSVWVEVERGEVALKGVVDAYWKKKYAGEITQGTRGVIRVRNKLAVVPRESVSDEHIAGAVMSGMDHIGLVNVDELNVMVEGGNVVLTGTVPSSHARAAALRVAANTRGVRSVTDNLLVVGEPGAELVPPGATAP